MSPRDNTDKMTVDEIDFSGVDEHWFGNMLNWQRKDKIRNVWPFEDGLLVEYEDVPAFRESPEGAFAALFIVRDGVARLAHWMRRDDRVFWRRDPVGAGFKNIFRTTIRLADLPDEGEEFGVFFAGTRNSKRSAIRKFTMPGELRTEEPVSLLDAVKAEREKYEGPITFEDAVAIINAVCWDHPGWGMQYKDTGSFARLPDGTPVRLDVIVNQATNLAYDVLANVKEGEGSATWNLLGESDRPFVAPVDPEGGEIQGRPWPFFADGRAPVLAMSPSGEQPSPVWQRWLQDIYPTLPTDGTHTPHLAGGAFPAFELLHAENVRRDRVTACWCVRENEGGPEDALQIVRRLVELYDEIPGPMIVGPTFDVWQAQGWGSEQIVNRWIADARAVVGDREISIGARARRGMEDYDGDHASYESHVNDIGGVDRIFAGAVRAAGDRPVGEFDRFRVRDEGRDKDVEPQDLPILCAASRRRRVAIIIGETYDGEKVNDVGTGVFTFNNHIAQALGSTPTETPDEETMIIDPASLERFRLSLSPKSKDIGETKWNKAELWEPSEKREEVVKENDAGTLICYGIGIFVGMAADDRDEIFVEPAIIPAGKTAGHHLPRKVEEKDSGGMAFDAYSYYPLNPFVRISPGDKLRVKGTHSNLEHRPHGSVDFYCFRES